MGSIIGLINLHHNIHLGVLSESRDIGSTEVAGRYSFIDFPLSNFVNSGIEKIGVLVKDKARSIFRHLGFTNSWAFNTKTGGISILYNEAMSNNYIYNTDVNNLKENSWFFRDSGQVSDVVIASAHILMSFDYSKLVHYHKEHDNDITILYKHNLNGHEEFAACSELIIKE
ncbi:MAG: hypothetical protein LBM99_01845, partial [Bacillales bacterium]|nr:hypothetical protein [Bacillales bacterium]